MEWWLGFIIIWLSLDVVILAVISYGIHVIKPRHPAWWKRVIVDNEPDPFDFRR